MRSRPARAQVGALRACLDAGLLEELDLGDEEIAELCDKVYAKVVDQTAAPELRAAALAFALDFEDFDGSGDAQRALMDLGRFAEASILGDEGPPALAPLIADAFLALPASGR